MISRLISEEMNIHGGNSIKYQELNIRSKSTN